MSEMIERVALAISGCNDPVNVFEIHRNRARLAIEAMRDLPETVIHKVFGASSKMTPDTIPWMELVSDWQSLINVVLNEDDIT